MIKTRGLLSLLSRIDSKAPPLYYFYHLYQNKGSHSNKYLNRALKAMPMHYNMKTTVIFSIYQQKGKNSSTIRISNNSSRSAESLLMMIKIARTNSPSIRNRPLQKLPISPKTTQMHWKDTIHLKVQTPVVEYLNIYFNETKATMRARSFRRPIPH